MDSDPSQIPVVPIPFEHGLTHFAQGLTRGQAKIVAIGSSTTAGRGNITAYPGRLLSLLQNEHPKANIAMVNKGIGGQEAPIELQRFDTDVIAEKPDLVLAGRNECNLAKPEPESSTSLFRRNHQGRPRWTC